MARALRHPEMPTLAYKYDIRIIGDVPQAMWDTAKQMNILWNEMVARYEPVRECAAAWYDAADGKEATAQAREWSNAAHGSLLRNGRGGELYELAKTYKGALPNECYWHIYDAFQKAQKRFAKGQGGAPRFKHSLQSILIPYPLGEGGAHIDWLHQERRAHVRQPQGPTRGWFTVAGARVPFEVVMDRPLPQGALIKRVALSGKLERPFGWQWSLIVSLQVPPHKALPKTRRVAGLDLGWRTMGQGLRIGVLTDNAGDTWELFLPFDLSTSSDRKFRARLIEQGATDLPLLRDPRSITAAQGDIDDDLEACKAELRRYDRAAWPTEARQMMLGIAKMRAGGLHRLRRCLADAGIAVETLDEWATRYERQWRRLRAAQLDWLAARNYLYRCLAAWLADNYDVIAWEQLGLKEMAEADEQEPAIRAAQKHRQWAALHILRGYVREAMNKRGRDLRAYDPAWSTLECRVCQALAEPSSDLFLRCANGHVWDQDENAAGNLLSVIEPELRAVTGVSRLVEYSQLNKALRPVKPTVAKAA